MPYCEESSISVGIICWKKSGHIRLHHFIQRLWASQTSENMFYKTVCFLSFSRFYWFLESCNFVISEDNFKFKKCKKALSKLFLKPLINFSVKWSLHAQNAVWMQVLHPIFAPALCNNREYLGGGECPYKECSVRSFSYWPTAVRRGILSRRQRSKQPNFFWAFWPSCRTVCIP